VDGAQQHHPTVAEREVAAGIQPDLVSNPQPM
jgi:hypothetical protein